MQIIVPMSGFGERFRRAGYHVPKPLIPIDGKPIIAHVIDMFPGEKNFIFICNQDHLDNPDYQMSEILHEYCPSGKIVGIPPHKLGPVHAVRQVLNLVDSEQPVVVNYCDFTCFWDWLDFKDFVASTACAGAIPAYKGFHPHSLGSTNYAYLRETAGWVSDIQEKQPYTNDRMNEFASSGTYYFASGRIMADAFQATMEQQLNVAGEYYVSLSYKPLLAAHLPVAVYPLQHFMQWGTPDDVAEFKGWSSAFKRLTADETPPPVISEAVVMPMAGLGQRFAQQGYTVAKPLIPVSGKPMVAQATHDLPAAGRHAFVLRGNMPGHENIARQLISLYPQAVVSTIPAVTEGQACTALLGVDALEERDGPLSGSVTFGACDNGVLYDTAVLQSLLDDPSVDVIVWGVRGHANAVRRPAMFGWIDAQDGVIRDISVKTPLGTPASDPIVIGTFTFRRVADFRRALARLIARDGRIGGEFYLDACINDAIALGLQCRLFEVDAFLSWGTPADLQTFAYWQSCFDKWVSHPYRLEQDSRVAPGALQQLRNDYAAVIPERPAVRQA